MKNKKIKRDFKIDPDLLKWALQVNYLEHLINYPEDAQTFRASNEMIIDLKNSGAWDKLYSLNWFGVAGQVHGMTKTEGHE